MREEFGYFYHLYFQNTVQGLKHSVDKDLFNFKINFMDTFVSDLLHNHYLNVYNNILSIY